MHSIADLLQADPFDSVMVRAALNGLGFDDRAEPDSPDPAPARRAEGLIDALARTPVERAALYPLLDPLLEELGHCANPLGGLTNLVRFAETAGDRVTFFDQLRQRPAVMTRLCRVLAFSQALADTLVRQSELLDDLSSPARPSSRSELRSAAWSALDGAHNTAAGIEALRRFRRRETVRIGLLDLDRQAWNNASDLNLVVRQLSDLAQVSVEIVLALVRAEMDFNADFSVLALGKLGARELGYSSQIELLFVGAGSVAELRRFGCRLIEVLSESGAKGTEYRIALPPGAEVVGLTGDAG